jgi:hypothetical protein
MTDLSAKLLIKDLERQAQKDKILAFILKNKKLIALALAALVLFSVLLSFLAWQQQKIAEESSAQLHLATKNSQDGQLQKAQQNLQEIFEGKAPQGVKAISALKNAGILLEQENFAKALEQYLQINKNGKFDPFIREYAGLNALKIMILQKDQQSKILQLADELEKNSKILKYQILEQKALAQLSFGQFAAGQKILENLLHNPETSQIVKARAEEILKIYQNNKDESAS